MFDSEDIPTKFQLKGTDEGKNTLLFILLKRVISIIFRMISSLLKEIKTHQHRRTMEELVKLQKERDQHIIEIHVLKVKLEEAEAKLFNFRKRKIPAKFDEISWKCVEGGFAEDPDVNQSKCLFCGRFITHHGEANKIRRHMTNPNNTQCRLEFQLRLGGGTGGDGIDEKI